MVEKERDRRKGEDIFMRNWDLTEFHV